MRDYYDALVTHNDTINIIIHSLILVTTHGSLGRHIRQKSCIIQAQNSSQPSSLQNFGKVIGWSGGGASGGVTVVM